MTRANCGTTIRPFTVRFRCLLDNTSGFITLELSGRLQFLHGQARAHPTPGMGGSRSHHHHHNHNSHNHNHHGGGRMSTSAITPGSSGSGNNYSIPPLGLFVVCSPLGPMPSLNGPQRDMTFKTKHQLDLTVTTIDSRTQLIFNYKDNDLQNFKVYDLVHPEDLQYVAQGHREVFKIGSIGLLVHRWLCKSGEWIWLQSRVRLVTKNNKQDHIIAIHRQLSQQEGMELLIRRSDEYKLPFPLLEPETLLSDDGTTSTNSRLVSDYSGSFTASQIKDFESSFISSIVNGTVKPGTGMQKTDQLCTISPEKIDNCYSVSDHEVLTSGMKRASSTGTRSTTESSRLLKANNISLRSAAGQTANYSYSMPNQMIPTGASASRTKSQVRMNGPNGRRRKQSTKTSIQLDYDPASLSYGTKNLALSLTSGSLTPYVTGYGQPDSSSTCMRSDFTSLEASLRPGGPISTFTGHPVSETNQTSFDQFGYYLGWRNTTDNGYLFNPSATLSHTTPQTAQSCSTDATGRIFSQGIPGHTSRADYAGHGETDSAYGHYGTPYDAYSAAVAAAAVVAAANSCHSTNSSGPTGLNSYVEQAFPRFYTSPSDENGGMFLNQASHVNSLHGTIYQNSQRSVQQFPRTGRDRTFSANTTMNTSASVTDPYEVLKQTTGLQEPDMPFNRYLKTNDFGDLHSASKHDFVNYSAFHNLTEKGSRSFGSVNTLPTTTSSTHQYETMYDTASSYGESFGEKSYGSTVSQATGLRRTHISSLTGVNPELQTPSSLIDPKSHRERSWPEAGSNQMTNEEFYFRSTATEDSNAVINRSTSSPCSSSSGRSATPGMQADRADYSVQTNTHANAPHASPRWDPLSTDSGQIVFTSHSPERNGAHPDLSGQDMKHLERNYTLSANAYVSTKQHKKLPVPMGAISHGMNDGHQVQSSNMSVTTMTDGDGPMNKFRETLMGLI
ncbi:Aryl hydrocarbon receptor [Fasciola gigantica]|uniref:Aryl hydrocarbon receptor n=1 Tax=Fasciola gigantica TaxID=46835 RepID=A0A504YZT9_FASGI|nr:Aryl hydrocarbon receptor [Fasciola gigantica]